MENLMCKFVEIIKIWPKSIDISDGSKLNDNGFYSENLSNIWRQVETNIDEKDTDGDFMGWLIFKALHKKAIQKFSVKEYEIYTNEITIANIEEEYANEKS